MADFRKLSTLLDDMDLNLTDDEVNRLYKIVEEGKTEDVDNIINLITQKFSQLAPSSRLKTQSERADSSEFKEQFADFFADLISLYMLADKLNKLIEKIDEKNISELEKYHDTLRELQNDLELKRTITLDKEGFSEVTQESFRSADSIADYQSSLFVDPQTEIHMPKERICDKNEKVQCLLAATRETIDDYSISYEKTGQTAEAFIEKSNEYNVVNNLSHKNPEKKWDETILSPEIIDIEQEDHLFKEYTDLHSNEYDYITDGALCKIKATLDSPTPINLLMFDPFIEYPFEIVKIVAFPSEEKHELFHNMDNYARARSMADASEILGPEGFNEIQDTLILDRPSIINFTEISECSEAQVLEFAIRQKNLKNTEYNITQEDKLNIDIIDDFFADQDIKTDLEQIDAGSVPELDYHNRRINWSLLGNLIEGLADEFDIDNRFLNNLAGALDERIPDFDKDRFQKYLDDHKISEENSPIPLEENNRFEYHYGMKNINASFENFYETSIFVSRLYEVASNIKEVALHVSDSITEYQNFLGADYNIEYYVSNLENPSAEDWYPILPQNYQDMCRDENGLKVTEVVNFYNDAQGNNVSDLRFRANTEMEAILKNAEGQEIEFEFIEDDKIYSDQAADITQAAEVTQDTFTITYYVHDNIDPFIVDFEHVSEERQFVDEDGKAGELFEDGTDDNNSITLSHYPYVDYEQVNTAQVKPHEIEAPTELEMYNPDLYKYNPNYDIQNEGYRPIVVEMQGQAEAYDVYNDQEIIIEEAFYNDTFGIPYEFQYVAFDEGNYVTNAINRQEQMAENNIVKPHFYNKTDYLSESTPTLNEYDAEENPVFEYLHEGNKIYFNDTFTDRESDNIGDIRVHYNYLTEGIRVMAIMRQKSSDSDATPIIYNYKIKQRDFDL